MAEDSALLKVIDDVRARLDELEAELGVMNKRNSENPKTFDIANLTQEEAKAMLMAWFNENNRKRFGREHKAAGWVARADRWALAQQAGFKSYNEAGDFLDGGRYV